MSTTELPEADWIRGITTRQPWATCIVTGEKTIENRPVAWAARWVLLHAGSKVDRPALRQPLVARTVRGLELPTRAVVGVARITDCHQDPEGSELCSPWAQPGRHHLVLADVQALSLPIPADGALGPWRPSPDLIEQVLLQLPQLRPPAS